MVDTQLYATLVDELQVGKRLPQAVYLHADALACVPSALRALIEGAATRVPEGAAWNVLKLATGAPKISFLWYPRFFEDGFPCLSRSIVVDLVADTVGRRSYSDANPPILHRKEALLPSGHTAAGAASALTQAAERLGLFEASREIGLRNEWQARLDRLGLRVDGHQLIAHGGAPPAAHEVLRHRTALSRNALSTPMQALLRHGLIGAGRSVFDYGCGRGDDVRNLRASGIDAAGWDPHYAADQSRQPADVVNLGFVLNVIEDPIERADALRGAWALTHKVLSVGVLIGGRQAYERHRLFRDGVLTARGTFQKYFASSEFHDYLEQTLDREPIAVAPGIAFVFREDSEEQALLARRARRTMPSPRAPVDPGVRMPQRPRVVTRAATKWETHAELVNAFWRACISVGRVPEEDEFDGLHSLVANVGRPATVLRWLLRKHGVEALKNARTVRRNDALVFLALGLFERRRSLHALPEGTRRDIRAFLGSLQTAQAAASTLLYSVGEPAAILEAAREAAASGCGWMDGSHSLQLHTSRVNELPPILRVYVGCAARLYGDLETADLVKLHIWSGKISLMSYDSFSDRSLPDLIERVKINLRRQTIDFFEYGTASAPSQPLYTKSRFMCASDPNYERQVALEKKLRDVPNLDLSGFGPTRAECAALLARSGMDLQEFDLVWT